MRGRVQTMCELTFRFRAAIGLAVILAGAPVEAQETGTVSGTVTLRENGGLVDGAVIPDRRSVRHLRQREPPGWYERQPAAFARKAPLLGRGRLAGVGRLRHAGDIEIDLRSQRRVARFDLGLRNLDRNFIQGIRAAFTAVDLHDDHVDTLDGMESIDTRFNNRTYVTRVLAYQRQQEHFSGRFGRLGLEFGARVERNDYRTGMRVGQSVHAEGERGHAGEEEQEEGEHALAPRPGPPGAVQLRSAPR